MTAVNPILLNGSWDYGIALDNHTQSSEYIGNDPFGNPRFNTVRTDMGELVYQLKYRGDRSAVVKLAEAAVDYLNSSGISQMINIILPAPPTRERRFQPTFLIAEAIADRVGIFYSDDALVKTSTAEAKNFAGADGEDNIVSVQFQKKFVIPCNILLIDDIFDSGKTLNACVNALRQDSNTKKVFVLTMTKAKG